MKLENNTRLNSRDLRAFLCAGLAAINARPRDVRTIQVSYRPRARETTGFAYCDGRRRIELFVPRSFCGAGGCIVELAQVYEHELQHLILGLDHADMVGWYYLPVLWARGLCIRSL